ncbi:MAG: hypothetical protein KDD48_04910, partial [Bdellovibrionales bacterium]|nr:hypothetical protein [Bdellovibrionales bacterium]
MLEVECTGCGAKFMAPAKERPKVSFVGCSNIFKIQYDFQLACKQCQEDLQVSGNGQILQGVPKIKSFSTEEKTSFSVRVPHGQMNVNAAQAIAPTVKVKIGQIAAEKFTQQDKTTIRPFKILTQDRKQKASAFKAKISRDRTSYSNLIIKL